MPGSPTIDDQYRAALAKKQQQERDKASGGASGATTEATYDNEDLYGGQQFAAGGYGRSWRCRCRVA